MRDRSSQENSRRQFIKRMSVVAVALPAMAIVGKHLGETSLARPLQAGEECEWCGATDAPANPLSRIVIPPEGEAGEPLMISGKVYREDGRTPAAGVLIYAYHTNATGIYPKRTPDNGRAQWRHGYLRGWMKTGADGKYEFRTNSNPPHILVARNLLTSTSRCLRRTTRSTLVRSGSLMTRSSRPNCARATTR